MNEQKQTHYLSAAARKTKKYYAFEYLSADAATWSHTLKTVYGQGYIFNSAEERNEWVSLSFYHPAHGHLRKALTRDEARIKSKYGAFIEIEKED